MRRYSSIALLAAAFAGVSFVSGAAGAAVYSTVFFFDVPENHWASDSIKWIAYADIMTGPANRSGYFEPDGEVNRAQLATALSRFARITERQFIDIERRLDVLEGDSTQQELLSSARNAQRKSDLNTYMNVFNQYKVDRGTLPVPIPTKNTEICRTGSDNCDGLYIVDFLLEDYLVRTPIDPLLETTKVEPTTGYWIKLNPTNGQITLSAPKAELSEKITISE